ncbi:DUF308 domain-containing protein [Frondihabitans cladoniiphilus]|uniref:DUF308 domain-containing protein n=1 Tax=Frondihabitans cladoniiphilus TaxID=715785 RepID=A0ABP8WDE4_9MICO
MTALQLDAASDARYWPVPLLRAVPLLVLGMVITFVNNHSTDIGLLTFGLTTAVAGMVLMYGSRRWLDDSGSRTLAMVQGAFGFVMGVVAILFRGGGVPTLVAVVTFWALVSGVLELVSGLRRRRRSALGRDWMIVGAITLILAIAYLVVPADYSKELGGIEKIHGTLTSSTILVGLVGAYGALVGVFLVIQGLSLRWQGTDASVAEATTDPTIDGAHRP